MIYEGIVTDIKLWLDKPRFLTFIITCFFVIKKKRNIFLNTFCLVTKCETSSISELV
jgi:hypothetical protein